VIEVVKKQRVPSISSFCLLASVYYFAVVLDAEATPYTLYSIGAALCFFVFAITGRRWSVGYAFWLFVSFYTFAGAAVYLLRDAFYFNHPGNFRVPINIWLIVTLVTLLFSRFDVSRPASLRQNPASLQINIPWTLVFVASGFVASFFMFRGGVPLFANDVNAARARVAAEAQGLFWFLYMGLQMVLLLLLVEFAAVKLSVSKRFLRLLSVALLCFVLSLYGGRFFVLMPLLTTAVYLMYKSLINQRYLWLFVGLVLAVTISVSSYRMYGSADNLFDLLVIGVRNDFFPEMRTLVQLESLVGNFDSAYIWNPFLSFLPSSFYLLFGIDKNAELMLMIGTYLSAFDAEAQDVGYRVSILGEVYLGMGYWGVFCSSVIVNGLSIIINKTIKWDLFFVFVLIMFCMLVPYGVTFIRSSLIMLPFGYVILRLATSRRSLHRFRARIQAS